MCMLKKLCVAYYTQGTLSFALVSLHVVDRQVFFFFKECDAIRENNEKYKYQKDILKGCC